jgi:hypothetical protein
MSVAVGTPKERFFFAGTLRQNRKNTFVYFGCISTRTRISTIIIFKYGCTYRSKSYVNNEITYLFNTLSCPIIPVLILVNQFVLKSVSSQLKVGRLASISIDSATCPSLFSFFSRNSQNVSQQAYSSTVIQLRLVLINFNRN